MELGLRGTKAVVTGGSLGIGRAIALELAAEGAALAICARREPELNRTADELRAAGATVYAAAADVTDADALTGFIDAAAEALGGIDLLVNNAGRATPGTFATLSEEDWRRDLDLKLLAMIRGCRAALPHLARSKRPRIVNINAVHGKYPDPTLLATSTNRAACLAFTKALALELAPQRILVNSVNIGFVVTAQWEDIRGRRAPDQPAETFFGELARREVPLGRFGQPEEVAGLVAFLASERASYITGASIDVAGGMGRYV